MGTVFHNVLSSLCLICVIYVTYTDGKEFHVNSKGKTRTPIETTGRHADGSACPCPPCMAGKECSENLTATQPRFSTRFTFVEVNANHHRYGVPLPYNHTTYPAVEHCLCNAFEYNITAVENVMDADDKNRFGLFKINRRTGRIRLAENRASDITSSDLYRLTVSVRNVITDSSDQTTITVAREKSEDADMYSFEAGSSSSSGFESEHVIHKRSIPSEVTFTLNQLNSVTEMRVGTRVTFELVILFPAATTDISVELFTPDNETTVMILCDVEIASIGSNLGTTLDGTPVYGAKDGWDIITPDWAVLDFGLVTNNESNTVDEDASSIKISYAAVMIENPLTQNASTYSVSAGAEFDNENKIFVAQAWFQTIVDGTQDVALDPVFNVTMPTNIALGSSHIVDVEMYIPYPYRDYTFKVFTPADTIGVMSICGIWFEGLGQNFGCGNDVSQITSATEVDPQASGNAIGVLELGKLLNKASRDDVGSIVVPDNKVALSFIAYMFPDVSKINQVLSLGLFLEVDTDMMLIGSSNFTVDPEVTTGLTDPVFLNVTSNLNSNFDDATVGQPFTLTYLFQVPPPATTSVASHYILEILAPFDMTPIFSVCSFEVISVGRDMPCVKEDDLLTEYSSRVADGSGTEPDRATIDLGFVTNLQLFGQSGDDTIEVKAVLMPLASHSSAVAPSTHTVSLGVQVGLASVSLADTPVSIAYPGSVTPITNNTAPSFSMEFYDSDNNVPVMGSTEVLVNMTTSRNITYDEMDMEFLMPTGPDYSYFHLCRVDIVSSGRNMPCMIPDWYRDMVRYTSQFDQYEMDRARLTIGSMCNFEFEDDVEEDVTTFAFYLKVLNRPDLLHMTSKWLSIGLQYSSANLWVGQLKLYATTGTSVSPTKSFYAALSRNTTTAPIPIGHTLSYSLLIKIGRGDTVHLQVKATAQTEGAHICTVRVIAAGSNLPCVVDEVTARTYTDWPSGSGRKDVELDLGIVTNYGSSSENMTANNYFDSDSIIVEVLARANPAQPAGTNPVDILVFYNTARTQSSSFHKTDFITTEALPSDTSVPDPVIGTFTVGQITGGLDNTTDIAIGEAKRILLTVVIPEDTNYDLEFAFIIPSEDVGKIEICDAAILSVGDNLPCIDALTDADRTSSSGGVFIDVAKFSLGYTCNSPLRPGDQKANTIVFEAYIRALPNSLAAVNEVVTVTATMRTFLTIVDVDSIDFTVTDPSLFVDRVMSLDGVNNETLISLDKTSPLVLGIGENSTVTANITIPKYSVSRFLFDVDLPASDSACLTISDIRVIGSTGRNVLCVHPDGNLKSIVYTPVYNATHGTSQRNYVFLDLGIVTNTGLTYRRETYATGDDVVQIEFDIQMADCDANYNGTIHKLSIGHKVANYIFIYDHDVHVYRDGNEKPEFDFAINLGAASTSTVIYAEGTVFHSPASTAEGKNTSIFLLLPAYQQAPLALQSASNQTCEVVPIAGDSAILQLFCDNFFFTDVFTFTAEIQINTLVILPVGFSGMDSVAQCWVGSNYVSRFATYDNEDWFPYPISGQNELQYAIDGGIDTSTLSALGLEDSGIVDDCQISSSSGNIAPASNARLNNVGAWSPYVRNGKFASNRFLAVYFGNLHKFSKVAVQQDEGHADLVTDITVDYTDDWNSWFGAESVFLGQAPSTLETVTLSGRTARGVRVSLTNDTVSGTKADVGVKFEFYGSKLSSDVTQADACKTVADNQLTVPAGPDHFGDCINGQTSANKNKGYPTFGSRSFVVDSLSNTVYVCDRRIDSKMYSGECKTSSDLGTSWEKLDPMLECMIGYETSNSRLYAYAQNRKIVVRESYGPWQNVPLDVLGEDMLKLTWINAITVPEVATVELDRITPHTSYKIQTWGATFEGMFENNVIKMKWTAL